MLTRRKVGRSGHCLCIVDRQKPTEVVCKRHLHKLVRCSLQIFRGTSFFHGLSAYVFIPFSRASVPRIFIIRFMLYARTFKLISVLTFGSLFIRKCVAPIHALSVPKGCSTVLRRTFAASGRLISRLCICSSRSSCSHRLMKRYLPSVPRDFNEQVGHDDDQYLPNTMPSSVLL